MFSLIPVNQDKQYRRLQSNMSDDNVSGYMLLPSKCCSNMGFSGCFLHKLKSIINKVFFWSGDGVARLFQMAKCAYSLSFFRLIFGIVDNLGIE
jgi:hypothetical protein